MAIKETCTPPAVWKGKPDTVTVHSPVFGFHTRRVQSSSPPTDTTDLPSAVKCPAVTEPEWPVNTCVQNDGAGMGEIKVIGLPL